MKETRRMVHADLSLKKKILKKRLCLVFCKLLYL